MSQIDVEHLDDEHEQRRDFRRANGAPLVSDPNDPSKTLRYSRPSGYGKDLDDEEALTSWRIWKAMGGVAASKALQTQVLATKEEDKETKKKLRNEALNKGAANEAADTGTGLHAMTARAEDTADVWEFPEAYAPDLNAYLQALGDYGLISEMVEVPLVCDGYRTAGTADRLWRTTRELTAPNGNHIEIGDLLVGDIKTGKKLDFSLPAYAVQMALYAQGTLYDVVAEHRLPTPPINQFWGILAHLPVGKAHCDMLWIDLTVGNYGAWISHEVREWRRKWKNGEHDAPVIPMPSTVEALVIEAFDAMVVSGEMPRNASEPALLDALGVYAHERVKAIGAHDAARQRLLQRWPAGVPAPRKGIEDPEQMTAVLALLDQIEAEFSLPFGLPDPRLEYRGHRSGAPVRNQGRHDQ